MSESKSTVEPFEVVKKIDAQRIADTLVSALEGGTGYWCQIDNEKGPNYNSKTCDRIAAGHAHLLIIEDCGEGDEPKTHKLDRCALDLGLRIMADKYPKHFADIVNENDDAETGDVLLQCALLGEIVYG